MICIMVSWLGGSMNRGVSFAPRHGLWTEMSATSLEIQCFSPGHRPCPLATFKRRLAKLQLSDRASRTSRQALCLSSTALRLQEPLDSACRSVLRIDGDDDEDEAYKDSSGSRDEAAEKFATGSNGCVIGHGDKCEKSDNDRIIGGDHRNGSVIRDCKEYEKSGISCNQQSGSLDAALSSDPKYAATPNIQERERLRRERIGRANKGKIPWNKGKSHSPETIARLRERNKIVMGDPKMRERLRQHSHPQSQETREKIRVFMKTRMEFERKQLTIVQDWKDSIASMARRGIIGDDELQWDSYQILKKELHRQYYAAKKKRRKNDGPKRLQVEHRLKISEGVRAKWGDPEYRNRVLEAIQGTRQKGLRKFRDRLSDPEFDLALNSLTSGSTDLPLAFESKVGSYNDPLFEMKLKRIRMLRKQNIVRKESELGGSQFADFKVGASVEFLEKKGKPVGVQHDIYSDSTVSPAQVAAMNALEQAQHDARERARILLAEAERAAILAAQAMDAAGMHNESLNDSLLEAWTLLDEANKSILKLEVTTN